MVKKNQNIKLLFLMMWKMAKKVSVCSKLPSVTVKMAQKFRIEILFINLKD